MNKWAFLSLAVFCAFAAMFYLSRDRQVQPPEPETPLDVAEAPTQAAPPTPVVDPPAEVAEPVEVVEDNPATVETAEGDAPLLRLQGIVMDAITDAPLANATLYIPRGEERLAEATSDEAGNYAVDISLDTWFKTDNRFRTVLCEVDGYARQSKDFAQLDLPDPLSLESGAVVPERADFFMQPGSVIVGRVLDADTGAGIADVKVYAMEGGITILQMAQQNRGEAPNVTTDQDGAYTFQSMVPGSYNLQPRASKTGYVPQNSQTVALGVAPGETKTAPDIMLITGGVITGTVRNSTGDPVDDALVHLLPGNPMAIATSGMAAMMNLQDLNTQSDNDGTFTISGIPLGLELRPNARKEGFADAAADKVQFSLDDRTREVALVLSRGSTISGIVKFDDGNPAREEPLMLMPDMASLIGGDIQEPKQATTGTDGRFTITSLRAGKYSLSAGDEVNPMQFIPFGNKEGILPVEVDGQNDINNLELIIASKATNEIPANSKVLRGTIENASGRPVSNVRVSAVAVADPQDRPSAMSTGDGSFSVAGLRNDIYHLSVKSDKGNGSLDNVSVSMRPVIRLSAPTPVSGVVVDSTDNPVAGCAVTLISPLASGQGMDMQAFQRQMTGQDAANRVQTNEFGYFEFPNVDPGDYTVKARSNSAGSANLDIVMAENSPKTGLRIILQPGVRFSGRVLDGEGKVRSGANVHLSEAVAPSGGLDMAMLLPGMMGTKDHATATDAQGAFAFENVAPGTYTVGAESAPLPPVYKRGVPVTAGQNISNFDIIMPLGGVAEGTILSGGLPAAGLMVQLIGDNGLQTGTTDGQGYYRIENIPPGEYMAQAIDMARLTQGDLNGTMGPENIEILSGQTTVVDFAPPEGSVPISGRIGGTLPAMSVLTLRREGGPVPGTYAPTDMTTAMEAAKYQVGQAMVQPDGTFSLPGVEPGTYILEVTGFDDVSNVESLMEADQTPRITQTVEIVAGQPLQLDLTMPQR